MFDYQFESLIFYYLLVSDEITEEELLGVCKDNLLLTIGYYRRILSKLSANKEVLALGSEYVESFSSPTDSEISKILFPYIYNRATRDFDLMSSINIVGVSFSYNKKEDIQIILNDLREGINVLLEVTFRDDSNSISKAFFENFIIPSFIDLANVVNSTNDLTHEDLNDLYKNLAVIQNTVIEYNDVFLESEQSYLSYINSPSEAISNRLVGDSGE